jgi:hypothetical protein
MERIARRPPMGTFVVVFFVALLVSFTPRTYAGIRPSFGLDHCSWHATHIVIATEGQVIDGKLTVLESWRGDLRPGGIIFVPELASFKSKFSREIKTEMFGMKSDEPKRYVTGSRMILFLKKKDQVQQISSNSPNNSQTSDQWDPAASGGMNVSVLWIERDQSFAFIQVMNPGDSILTGYEDSEKEIRDRAFEVMHLQETENAAAAIDDESKRAEALAPFALSELYYARDLAFAELQTCGRTGLPVLRRMLGDQSFLKVHSEVIKYLAAAGGDEVADELIAIVTEELGFWKETGPRLKHGWWNDINKPETEVLRNRYARVLEALYSLRKLRVASCKEVVTEFRDFWRSLPQLDDKSGLDQMSEECDKILRELP